MRGVDEDSEPFLQRSAVFSWPGSCEKKAGNRTLTDGVEDEEEKKFLPLGAAAMNSQKPQHDDHQVDDTLFGSGTGMRTGIDWRRGHKWRDILLMCTTGNAERCGAIETTYSRPGSRFGHVNIFFEVLPPSLDMTQELIKFTQCGTGKDAAFMKMELAVQLNGAD